MLLVIQQVRYLYIYICLYVYADSDIDISSLNHSEIGVRNTLSNLIVKDQLSQMLHVCNIYLFMCPNNTQMSVNFSYMEHLGREISLQCGAPKRYELVYNPSNHSYKYHKP